MNLYYKWDWTMLQILWFLRKRFIIVNFIYQFYRLNHHMHQKPSSCTLPSECYHLLYQNWRYLSINHHMTYTLMVSSIWFSRTHFGIWWMSVWSAVNNINIINIHSWIQHIKIMLSHFRMLLQAFPLHGKWLKSQDI